MRFARKSLRRSMQRRNTAVTPAPKKLARNSSRASKKGLIRPSFSGKASLQFRRLLVMFGLVFESVFGSEHVSLVLVHSVDSQFVWGGKGSFAYSALE